MKKGRLDESLAELARKASFMVVDSADHLTGKTGLSPTVRVRYPTLTSWATLTASATGLDFGWYEPQGLAATLQNEGMAQFHISASATFDPVDFDFLVEPAELAVDAVKISGDSTAADNLELMYDGTGYVDDTAPASRAQVGAIAVTGAAVNVVAESYVLTTGTQSSGTFADAATVNGVYHQHTDDTGAMDLYYQFDVGAIGVPTSALLTGFLNGNNDSLDLFAYNWGATAWDQVATLPGQVGTADAAIPMTLFTSHVGTGANRGKVRIRAFAASGLTTATLNVDQIFVSFANQASAVGYANGAIWVDTLTGTAGAVANVNGVADLPVLTWADALAISASTGIKKFQISGGSSVALTADSSSCTINGSGSWSLNLGGQQIDNAFFSLADIQGTGTISASGETAHFVDCDISLDAATTLGECHMVRCGFGPSLTTFATAGLYSMVGCYSNVAGTGQPELTLGTGVVIELGVRSYPGSLRFNDMDSNHTISFDSASGRAIADSSCTGGQLKVSFPAAGIDESSGAVDLVYIRPDALDTGTLRSGGNGKNIVQLAATAPSGSTGFDGAFGKFTKGTTTQYGEGIEYDVGSTRLFALRENLKTQVDNTWNYEILPAQRRESVNNGITLGGTTTVVYLNALANQTTDAYRGQVLRITATPAAQSASEDVTRKITASVFTGGFIQASLDEALPIALGTESSYEIYMTKAFTANDILDLVIEDNGQGTTWTLKGVLRAFFSVFSGFRTGGGTSPGPKSFGVPGSSPNKVRVVIPTDANGNSTGDSTIDVDDI